MSSNKYYLENREAILNKAIEYYWKNKDKCIEYMKAYNKIYYHAKRKNQTSKVKEKPIYNISIKNDDVSTTILFDD